MSNFNKKNLIEGETGSESTGVSEAGSLLAKKTRMVTNKKVGKVLDRTVDPEKLEWLGKLLDKGYERSINTLKQFGLYDEENQKDNDKKVSTLDEVKRAVLSSVTPEQIEVISDMQRPLLLLVPNTSRERYLKALDSKKPIQGQIDAYVPEYNKWALKQSDEEDNVVGNDILGWRWAIVEGDTVLPGSADNREILRTRIRNFRTENEGKGIKEMDLKQYILLQMQTLLEGKPVDQETTWTTLIGEPNVTKARVVRGSWDTNRVRLSYENVINWRGGARFRPSVMGEL